MASLDIAFCAYDANDCAMYWNQTFLDFFPEHAGSISIGEPYTDNLRRFFRSRLSPDDIQFVERHVAEGLARHRAQSSPFKFTHNGRSLQVASLPSPDGSRMRVWREITERASVSEAGLPAFDMLNCIPDGACVADSLGRLLAANDEFRRLYSVPSCSPITGLTLDEIVDAAWKSGRAGTVLRAGISNNLSYEKAPFEVELPEGRWRRVVTRHEESGVTYQIHSDISALKWHATDMRIKLELSTEEARTDSLTGLPNRRAFDELAAQEAESSGHVTLIAADIDFFKAFNDTLGHPAGDDYLKQVGKALQEVAAHCGMHAARIGGDEFAILVPTNSPLSPEALAKRCAARTALILIGDSGLRISLSFGIGTGKTVEAARDFADRALYAAKRQGRDRVISWTGRLDQQRVVPRQIEKSYVATTSVTVEKGKATHSGVARPVRHAS